MASNNVNRYVIRDKLYTSEPMYLCHTDVKQLTPNILKAHVTGWSAKSLARWRKYPDRYELVPIRIQKVG